MKTYFYNLNERERWMVIITGLCLFFYCYYLLLYAPLNNKVTQKSAQLIEKTETLAWMQKVRQQNKSSQKKQNIGNSQLLTILAEKLKEHAALKFPYQLQQTGPGDIQLTFDEIPFKLFMGWLAKLNSQYTITIKQFDVGHTKTPGVTKIMIIISAENPK